jgi:N-acetylmuramoyl-L-alanine amidase
VAAASKFTERADLQARVNLANSNKPDLFISIHHNANINPDKKGTTTYYSTRNPKAGASAKLAGTIQDSLIGTIHSVDDGVRSENYYVLCNTTMPAVLIEVAYISNPYEEERQQNPIFQKNVASAVFHGVYEYFNGN